jgi:predicted nuclease of predicted toxin-antitoxin system
LPRSLVGILEGLGHQACEVIKQMPGSTRDEVVIEYAKKHGLILLTCDFDFADIRN